VGTGVDIGLNVYMFASGISIMCLLSMCCCSVYISDCCCGTPMIVVDMYHDSLTFGLMYNVESRSYVGFLCMSASLWYVLKNSLPS